MHTTCVILQGNHFPGGVSVAFEDNALLGCPHQNKRLVFVNLNQRQNTYHIRKNIFSPGSTDCESVRLNGCRNCDVSHNQFNQGEIQFGGSDGTPHGVTFNHNTLRGTKIDDRTNGNGYSCQGNSLGNIEAKGSSMSGCD